jgi:hypothetical protein
MSTYEQQRESEQVVGTLTGVVHKGEDKYQAVVAPDGSQYTKNLWTKDAQIVGYLSSQVGNRIAFACNVSHWNLPDGTPVRSLWIDQVGPPAPGSPAMRGPAQQQPVMATMVHPPLAGGQQVVVQPQVVPTQAPQQTGGDVKEQRIHRQTASKVAGILLAYLPEEQRNLSTLFTLSERLVAYYNDGLPNPETVEQLIQRAMPQGMEGPPPDPGQFAGDDDIPF